ncbi:hypothetical protein ACHAW6_004509 [Cyclotella cf. meneghiniana]
MGVHSVNFLASVAIRFPHSAYAGLVSCLMAEWPYTYCIILDISPLLAPIEDTLRTKFLPAILSPNITIDNDLQNLLSLSVKSGGVTIQNPTLIADSLFCTFHNATYYLSGSLLHNKPICTHHHCSVFHTTDAFSQKEHHDGKDAFLQALLMRLPLKVKKCLECAGATGAWLTTIPDRFSDTMLTKTKWLDNIALQYGSCPPHLPSCCNGCVESFTVKHALNCKKGRLLGIHHDDARDEWAHLCSLAFSNA